MTNQLRMFCVAMVISCIGVGTLRAQDAKKEPDKKADELKPIGKITGSIIYGYIGTDIGKGKGTSELSVCTSKFPWRETFLIVPPTCKIIMAEKPFKQVILRDPLSPSIQREFTPTNDHPTEGHIVTVTFAKKSEYSLAELRGYMPPKFIATEIKVTGWVEPLRRPVGSQIILKVR